jgi:hypothetical protein
MVMAAPSRAALQRAASKAGNHCGFCGRQFSSREPITYGEVEGRLVVVASQCCQGKLDVVWDSGVWVGRTPPPGQKLDVIWFETHPDHRRSPWMKTDAAWFKAHPQRSHHIRRAMPEEMPLKWVVVRQLEPGFRLRRGFNPPMPPPDSEILGHAIFDALHAAVVAGRDHITPDEIASMVAALARGGRA